MPRRFPRPSLHVPAAAPSPTALPGVAMPLHPPANQAKRPRSAALPAFECTLPTAPLLHPAVLPTQEQWARRWPGKPFPRLAPALSPPRSPQSRGRSVPRFHAAQFRAPAPSTAPAKAPDHPMPQISPSGPRDQFPVEVGLGKDPFHRQVGRRLRHPREKQAAKDQAPTSSNTPWQKRRSKTEDQRL